MEEQIKILYRGDSGKLLRSHIEYLINSLDKVSNIDITLGKDEIAIDALARIKAMSILKTMFKLTEPESKDTIPDVSRIKKRNGL